MLRYLSAGESHGRGLTVILEGLPAGLPLTAEEINLQLSRRQKGYGRGGRMKIENDTAEITSGVRHGRTIGSPVSMWIANKDWQSWQNEMCVEPQTSDGKKIVLCPRPGHADLAGGLKYNHRDLRNILERASARETVARVAAGAVARVLLGEFGITIAGHVICIGGIFASDKQPALHVIAKKSEQDELRCIDPAVSKRMKKKIDEARKNGDSVGGIFEVIACGVPPGLGSHVQWDRKLDGRLAGAVMSIQAIKGVEIGNGFKGGLCFGSEAHDEIYYNKAKKTFFHKTNRAGGLEGGISNGEPIVIRAVMKPISTLYRPLHSVRIDSKKGVTASVERSDICAVPSASVIAENVTALEIANAFLEKFGGDSVKEVRRNFLGYLKQIRNY